MLSHFKRSTFLSASVLAMAVPTMAQDLPADDVHNRQIDEDGTIVVTVDGLRELDFLAGTSVIADDDLLRELDGQLGAILDELPGVSTTAFAPGASRPVLRGQQGERVRVLTDGIGALDASNTSADHAVSIDPLTAERIEVLRGPAVLLYGSQAIGGVVNVIDKRIPRRVPGEPVHVDVLGGIDSATNLYEGAASLDLPVAGRFVFHADASYRNTDDIEVGGFTVAPILRAELLEEAAEEAAEGELEEADELREAAEQRGVLPNSFTETYSGNIGFSHIGSGGLIGVSAGIYDTRYGVPGRPGAGHAHGEEEGEDGGEGEEEGEERVSIDLRQYRADMLAEIELGTGFFQTLRLRAGYSDYTHTEFEGDEVGTVFDVQGIEARLELAQDVLGAVRGASGVQLYVRDFEAIGEEAFVAPNETRSLAAFTLQEFGSGPIQLEVGARYENTQVDSAPLGVERSFDGVSGAAGVSYEPGFGLKFGVNASYTERAPAAEELYSNGPHIATQAFEIGDVNLREETAIGGEAYVRGTVGIANISAAVFYNDFDDYIYLSETGEEEDDLPVFLYRQDDAEYYGAEGQVYLTFADTEAFRFATDIRAEYVRATLADGSPLPRIPPFTLFGAAELGTGPFDLRGEVHYFAEQDRVAAFETPTDDFTLVNASVAWKPFETRPGVTVIASADNIFDVVGRRHASFTKDFVPITGRNFKLSLRGSF